jgi:hypothetical protein
MIGNRQAPVEVSLYLFRDDEADRAGHEKYNILFFDTPEGEKSIVKVVTSVLTQMDPENPAALEIMLRGQKAEGIEGTVYSLKDHFFGLFDLSDGSETLLEGFYQSSFDGDVFDSNYTRIEGIRDGNLKVILHEGQPVWPRRTEKYSSRNAENP